MEAKPMSEERLAEIEAREKKATQRVHDLCDGTKRWTMRVPVDLEDDPDIIISSSLGDIPDLLTEVRRLRAQLAEFHALSEKTEYEDEDDPLEGWEVVEELEKIAKKHKEAT